MISERAPHIYACRVDGRDWLFPGCIISQPECE